jgi:hypothetical protein
MQRAFIIMSLSRRALMGAARNVESIIFHAVHGTLFHRRMMVYSPAFKLAMQLLKTFI